MFRKYNTIYFYKKTIDAVCTGYSKKVETTWGWGRNQEGFMEEVVFDAIPKG